MMDFASSLPSARTGTLAGLFTLALLALSASLSAQAQGGPRKPAEPDSVVYRVDPLVVTATRSAREVSTIPQPVSVVQQRDLVQQVPNTVTDLFRTLPGVDVIGVGVNQGRPQIRGQRGTRILLLEDLGAALADRVEVTAYRQRNERELTLSLSLRMGPGLLEQKNENFTDIATTGFRAEARKLAAQGLLLTYGVDYVKDHADGTDNNVTSITGFGPPRVTRSDRPQLPVADFSTMGAFLQGEIEASDRLSFVAGGRYQRAVAETFATKGLEGQTPVRDTEGTLVGAVNAILELGWGVSLVGTVGRGFRSPNLIERFFDGSTPEGSGYQVRNPDLKPETSVNQDLGVRHVTSRASVEAFTFRNTIHDGIRIEPLGTMVNNVAAYQNNNVDELLFRGVELSGEVLPGSGFSTGASYTWQDAANTNDQEVPVGETFSSKVTGTLRYTHPSDRFWTGFEVRHNGKQKDVMLEDNPLGDIIPSFTVMNLRGGVTVIRTEGGHTHRLGVSLTNLTNRLYAEFSNASFFRPEPKRNLTLSWEVSF